MGNVEPAIRQNAAELERQVGGVALRVKAAVALNSADNGGVRHEHDSVPLPVLYWPCQNQSRTAPSCTYRSTRGVLD